jgi:hypothetical protein
MNDPSLKDGRMPLCIFYSFSRLLPANHVPVCFPVADQHFSLREGLLSGARVCALNRRTPLLKENERILPDVESSDKWTSLYHQLLGHLCQIQGDLLQECQRDTHAQGDPTDWRLLLQVDSDDDAQMMWGDVGMLYFYIPQQALIARDFSQVHLVMQCT